MDKHTERTDTNRRKVEDRRSGADTRLPELASDQGERRTGQDERRSGDERRNA